MNVKVGCRKLYCVSGLLLLLMKIRTKNVGALMMLIADFSNSCVLIFPANIAKSIYEDDTLRTHFSILKAYTLMYK